MSDDAIKMLQEAERQENNARALTIAALKNGAARIAELEKVGTQIHELAIRIGAKYSDCDLHVLDNAMVWELIKMCDEDGELRELLEGS